MTAETDAMQRQLEAKAAQGANLVAAHLGGAALSRAHLENAYLEGAHLEDANLMGAHLEGATLCGSMPMLKPYCQMGSSTQLAEQRFLPAQSNIRLNIIARAALVRTRPGSAGRTNGTPPPAAHCGAVISSRT
jgi:hypothetical protein